MEECTEEVEIIEAPDVKLIVIRKFGIAHDISLLKELLACEAGNPFSFPVSHAAWKAIGGALAELYPERMKGLTARAVKDRADKLVKDGRATDNKKARQSGTDEQYGRKEAALLEVVSLYEEAARKKKEEQGEAKQQKKTREENERVKAAEMRTAAFSTLGGKRAAATTSADSTSPGPVHHEGGKLKSKRTKAQAQSATSIGMLLEYLENKRAEDSELKKQQLELERQKFEASQAERSSMLQLISKMMDKCNK